MAPQDDWSDSDEEVGPDMETSVLLGIPDGVIEAVSDLDDAAVSRIGGYPAFLPSKEPPFPSSQCKVCSNPMELLVQLWCPFEDSPMDRALYIWGCANSGCQRKEGSVRAWRGLRYNAKYAAKLEIKLAKKKEREARARAAVEAEKAKQTTNPFSIKSSQVPSNPFGLGAQIFGDSSPPPDPNPADSRDTTTEDVSDTESTSSKESLLTAMAATTLDESVWRNTLSYPPLYLSTISEYIPPPPKAKGPTKDQLLNSVQDGDNKDMSWVSEVYENSLDVDSVFDRFSKRVGYEGAQCVRYDLKGTPLPFASDGVFETLFPAPASPPLPVTKPDFKVVQQPKRSYAPSSAVPDCPACKGKRVFECQLMPNLINVLRRKDGKEKEMTEEERRKAVEQELKGGPAKGMEWGTCMVFSCENDCRIDEEGNEMRDVWQEEKVFVQWDV